MNSIIDNMPAQGKAALELLRVSLASDGIEVATASGLKGEFPWAQVLMGITAAIQEQGGTEAAMNALSAATSVLHTDAAPRFLN
ncbi:hypothetical protein SR914_08525 [Comamonas testosteroni]|jgi:hypothetical protein|uniref:Uncharacterized protein n=1 Tax=Comamonas testosteroni (strain DSM 14576 / KF-1) TaxID=399795 RepID=B7WQB0_COMTK|nr:hypothetical protein [Comamonas testosteroni]EED65081.1 hypothetical protein CtesDRAFT_PD0027 [Comamonas testosteroni KF-1]WQG68431.1 hypothetical protein SR914_08525 [Comamonas testosteroni]HMS07323.1 hypothetical protein [Burkholderiaceae bacterium]